MTLLFCSEVYLIHLQAAHYIDLVLMDFNF